VGKFTEEPDQVLVRKYRDAAVRHGIANETADYRSGNKDAGLMLAIYKELAHRGLQSQTLLLPLLDDVDSSVKAWVATHALNFAAPAALATLKSLVSEGGLAGFNAEMVLKEWNKGRLRIP
jgi:hypothetical protein